MEEINYKNNKKLLNRFLIISFFLIFLVLSFYVGFNYGMGKREILLKNPGFIPLDKAIVVNKESADKTIDFSLFWSVYEKLKKKYVDVGSLDGQKLLYGSIKGMLQATGDPYTVFLDPEENKVFESDLSGSFEGIGAEMGIKKGILTIIAPLEDSPAQKAGLMAGDKVIKINNESTAEMLLDEAVSKIRGPKGTEVKLTIWRNGSKEETQDVVIVRDVINVKSVKLEFKDDKIAYVKIIRFGDETSREFNQIASQILAKNAKGLIIDLRNNPGGYLEDAIEVASKMLPKEKIVVIEEGVEKRNEIKSRGGNLLGDLPTVILINEGSASASEILAGALRENRSDVVIVGKKSFGKGSVQEKIEMPQNTAVKITVARWLTPSGRQINEQGIDPDVEVDLTEEDYQNDKDPQFDKAIEIIKEKIK